MSAPSIKSVPEPHIGSTSGPPAAASSRASTARNVDERIRNPARLEAAYNDAAGVTAAFTLNMLARFNRELDANFDLSRFRHHARYNALAGRIETFLVSEADQKVRLGGETFHFERGEAMLVEYSCKYTLDEFAQLARGADLRIARSWTDEDGLFAVLYLISASATPPSGEAAK